jgi:adenine C2-methylase RlmN of 23S rRNA A2503 and tRNA A37
LSTRQKAWCSAFGQNSSLQISVRENDRVAGAIGFKRNLRAHEIVEQIISAGRSIAPRRITNIVFMGMGEPLANFDEVTKALTSSQRKRGSAFHHDG